MRITRWATYVAAAVFAAGIAGAQQPARTYPVKAVRVVTPFAAGGGTDIIARLLAQKLTEQWSQTVIVDNRGGANGNIGTDFVARAAPDGYTLLLTTNAPIVINPHMTKLPYNPQKDLVPISLVASVPFVLVTHPSLPVKDLAGLIALAKARPGELNYGSSGSGGGAHLSGEMLKLVGKVDITHLAYKGSGPALNALLSGEVEFMFVSTLTASPLVAQNRVRAIGVTSKKRISSLPNVQAMAEFPGMQNFDTDAWYGLMAPAKTDRAIIEMVYQDSKRALSQPEIAARFEKATGAPVIASTPAEFEQLIRADDARWGALVRATGVKMD